MSDPAAIRARIERCRAELARAEGEEEALNGEIDSALKTLRSTLRCKPGKEKTAIEALRKQVERDQAEVEELLDRAERVDGEDE